jgi:thiamine biosynthesis protein ThiS
MTTIISEIEIRVNGDGVRLAAGATVASLLEHMQLHGDRVAVERNRAIVSRAQWESTALESGDALEIVHFVGGG